MYMPLPAAQRSLRLTSIRPAFRPSHTTKSAARDTLPLRAQQRVLRTTACGKPAAALHHRSPYQWSHIAHRARVPAGLSTPNNMADNNMLAAPQAQARPHMGHSHSHTHDTTFLTSSNKADPGVRITRVGLYVNLGMAIAKGAGGYIFNSQA